MATLVFTNGKQRIGVQASQATSGTGPTFSATRHIQAMSVDDSATAFAAGDTALNTGGAVTNEFDKALDSTPTRASQTITHLMTLATGDYNQVVKRVALHDDTAANVTTSSTTVVVGIDGLALTKAGTFTLRQQVDITYS